MTPDSSLPILVVDDFRTMTGIIRSLLTQLGFIDIDVATDGGQALSKLRQKNYGLVISDWNMAPMTGFELLQHVRADHSLAKIPFIMVTAESQNDTASAAREAGASNYMVKPFNASTLKAKIEAVFAE